MGRRNRNRERSRGERVAGSNPKPDSFRTLTKKLRAKRGMRPIITSGPEAPRAR